MDRVRNYSDWLVSIEMLTQQADNKIGQLSMAFEMRSPRIINCLLGELINCHYSKPYSSLNLVFNCSKTNSPSVTLPAKICSVALSIFCRNSSNWGLISWPSSAKIIISTLWPARKGKGEVNLYCNTKSVEYRLHIRRGTHARGKRQNGE